MENCPLADFRVESPNHLLLFLVWLTVTDFLSCTTHTFGFVMDLVRSVETKPQKWRSQGWLTFSHLVQVCCRPPFNWVCLRNTVSTAIRVKINCSSSSRIPENLVPNITFGNAHKLHDPLDFFFFRLGRESFELLFQVCLRVHESEE